MEILRTPDNRFTNLEDYPFVPRYIEIDGLRIHYVDEGDPNALPVLMLHGEPTWSYLYRHMIPVFVDAGFRAIAPDFMGFGKSDKPAHISDYSYQRHMDWMTDWLKNIELKNITLICQDWGSFIGLRLAAENPHRFSRIVVANGYLPTGDDRLSVFFHIWRFFARFSPILPIGLIMQIGCFRKLSKQVLAGYKAPFPDKRYKAGAVAFPRLVPTNTKDPATPANRNAWKILSKWDKPFLTVFGQLDPIFKDFDKKIRVKIPGAEGQPHTILKNAGHFIQEDKGDELAKIVLDFIG